jgi:hypothetical protein
MMMAVMMPAQCHSFGTVAKMATAVKGTESLVVRQFELLSPIGYAALMESPIACTLTEAEIRERRQTMLDFVRGAALNVTSLPLGYAYHFKPTSDVLAHLSRLVDLERQCCQFLTFRIVVEAGSQPFCLEVTGPPEAKAIIADLLGS